MKTPEEIASQVLRDSRAVADATRSRTGGNDYDRILEAHIAAAIKTDRHRIDAGVTINLPPGLTIDTSKLGVPVKEVRTVEHGPGTQFPSDVKTIDSLARKHADHHCTTGLSKMDEALHAVRSWSFEAGFRTAQRLAFEHYTKEKK